MQFKKQKLEMIERLRTKGIKDNRVLKALGSVPREKFVPTAFMHQAYEEQALPIGFGQTISHPYTVAKMTELLGIKPGMKVLEIGTGSGYQSAVLCELGAQLFTIEINRTLALRARKILQEQNYYFALKIGDGNLGWPDWAPFDIILFTAGARTVPKRIVPQLTNRGKLLIPVGSVQNKILTLYINEDGILTSLPVEKFTFVELQRQESN
jgi:protein-L-isoaspartate(D-aspartate) O-methyltransferase